MIHLLLAYKINPTACGLFFLGSFAPDTFDTRRGDIKEAKNKNHFRSEHDMDVAGMDAALKKFYTEIDKNNPFHMGYFVHLICDMWWYEYLQNHLDWYENIGNEYRIAGVWIRRNLNWVNDVFHKMKLCADDFQSPIPDPTNEEIIMYKNNLISPTLRANDNKADGNPSKILTPEFLETYSNEIAERCNLWVKAMEDVL